jgi:DNA-binding CsgD family transcriptional regulator
VFPQVNSQVSAPGRIRTRDPLLRSRYPGGERHSHQLRPTSAPSVIAQVICSLDWPVDPAFRQAVPRSDLAQGTARRGNGGSETGTAPRGDTHGDWSPAPGISWPLLPNICLRQSPGILPWPPSRSSTRGGKPDLGPRPRRCNAANVTGVPQTEQLPQRDIVDQPGSPPPVAPCCCHAPHFTQHELLILSQVAAGATNEEIAASLSISGHTVAGHLRTMLGRSQARNRAELIARAYAAGVFVPQTWPPQLSGRRCLQVPAIPPLVPWPRMTSRSP